MPYFPQKEEISYRNTYRHLNLPESAPVKDLDTRTNYLKHVERRSGQNHPHVVHPSKSGVVGFTPDGNVKFFLGTQKVPRRRYRWVNGANGKFKQYYIAYFDRRIFVDVPVAVVSFRKSTSLLNSSQKLESILRPNALSYKITSQVEVPVIDPLTARHDSGYLSVGYSLGTPQGVLFPGGSARFDIRAPFSMNTNNWHDNDKLLVNDAALKKLYEKVGSDFPDVGTLIGEGRETLAMLTNILFKGVSLVKALKTLDLKRIKGEVKISPEALSSAWLTYVYGVKPLLGDVSSILDTSLRQFAEYRTYTASAHMDRIVGPTQLSTAVTTQTLTRKCRYTVKYGVIMNGNIDIFMALGKANLLNPVSVGYNLIPFSFMVDWLYDLGSVLSNQSALRYGFVYGWRTVNIHEDAYETYRYRSSSGPGYNIPIVVDIPSSKVTHECDRVVFTSWQFPAMPMPKFTPIEGLSTSRALNALSIFINRSKAFK